MALRAYLEMIASSCIEESLQRGDEEISEESVNKALMTAAKAKQKLYHEIYCKRVEQADQ